MATGRYKVILTGQFDRSRERGQIRADLMALFKLSETDVDRLLDSAPVTVKTDLDYDTASKYKIAIEQTGALCDLREVKDRAEEPMVAATPSAEQATPAAVPVPAAAGAHSSRGSARTSGAVSARVVDAGRGAGWWVDGWRLFKESPGAWLGIGVVMMLIMIVVQIIPLVGLIASLLLPPLFTAGAMLAAHEQQAGQPVRIERLFAGFSQRTGPLLALGGIYFAGTMVIAIVVGTLLVGAAFGSGLDLQHNLEDPGTLLGVFASVTGLLAILLSVVATLLLVAALWYAPALVMLRDVPPFAAMRASLVASLRNWLPGLVYGLLLFGFVILASLPFLLGFLLLVPLVLTSVYASYRDLFEE